MVSNLSSINIPHLLSSSIYQTREVIHRRLNSPEKSNRTMEQRRSFPLKKSASMDRSSLPNPTMMSVPKKNPIIEFPTSPDLIFGEEILHFSHPHHALLQINPTEQFTCMGCKEPGAGMRFSCQQCDFQLHEFCALASSTRKGHPLHPQHQLLFCSQSVKGGKTKCDVCAKTIKGYAFRCGGCPFQMHPCCAMLSSESRFPCHAHILKLLPATYPPQADPGNFLCGECKRKRSGRVYRCTACDYHLHAVCAKSMVNGLHANGYKGHEKPSMLGTAAKIASQVVTEIIGGILEGLAEGVGQALGQDITKGNGTSRRQ